MSESEVAEVASLLESGLFEPDWYSATFPDVNLSGLSAAEHFIRIGRRIGRHGSKAAAFVHGSGGRIEASEVHRGLPAAAAPGKTKEISSEVRRAVSETLLFDERWYREKYGPLIRYPDDLLLDYLESFAADPRRDPGPMFSTAFYAETYTDIGEHPFAHFVLHGLREGRAAFPPQKVNSFFDGVDPSRVASVLDFLSGERSAVILSWEKGNFFFSEIAAYMAAYLRQFGIRTEHRSNVSAEELNRSEAIVVAPHEFCVYGPGREWDPEQLARAIYVNTEQWHTSWFVLGYRFLVASGKVLDINPASAAALTSLGIDAAFLPLLPIKGSCFFQKNLPVSKALATRKVVKNLPYPSEFDERPYDVIFVGVCNSRRSEALAKLAPALQQYQCFLHCPEFHKPVRPGDPDMVSNSDLAQLARNSKILLNIHQGESRYFEWHRLFLSGIMEGCVVVTEKCHATGIVIPGEHYLEADLRDMPELLNKLLRTEEGAQMMSRVHANCNQIKSTLMADERAFL